MKDLATKMDTVSTQVTELITEMRMNRQARDKADGAHDATHAEQDRRLASLETWRTQMETTAAAAPPSLTWGRFFGDAKTWLLAALAVASAIFAFTR